MERFAGRDVTSISSAISIMKMILGLTPPRLTTETSKVTPSGF
jgi:hypothetical protein